MRTIQLLTLSLLTAGCFSANAQVGNTNFEDWVVTDTLWNGDLYYTADQWSGGQRTEESFSGAYAAKVEPLVSCGISRNYMVYGVTDPNHFNFWVSEPDFTGSGSPINFKPTELSGYFKFVSPQVDDEATALVLLKKFNAATGVSVEVGHGEIQFAPSNEYMPFSIQITDLQQGMMPDSIVIAFSSGMGFSWENEASSYGTVFVDQLRMQKGNAVAELEESTLIESHFFPNPVSNQLHVSFVSNADDEFTLSITDASGRRIINRAITPEVQTIIETGSLPAGIYHAAILGKSRLYGCTTIVKQ